MLELRNCEPLVLSTFIALTFANGCGSKSHDADSARAGSAGVAGGPEAAGAHPAGVSGGSGADSAGVGGGSGAAGAGRAGNGAGDAGGARGGDASVGGANGGSGGGGLSTGTFSIQPLDSRFSQPVTVDTTSTEVLTLTVSNDGDSPATPKVALSIAGEFAIVDGCSGTVVVAGGTCTVGVSFSPKSAGEKSSVVSVTPAGANASATIHALAGESAKQFTLSVARTSAVAGASGTVSGAGIDCGSTCAATVAAGATVALTAVPATGYYFGGWNGGGCRGGSLTCTTSAITANTTVTAQFTNANVIFTTSTVYSLAEWRAHDPLGQDDAVRGADKFCQERAAAGSSPFTKGRNFVSLLAHGSSGNDPIAFRAKLGNKRGWLRTDGLPFGDDLDEILTHFVVYYPPSLDENGARNTRIDSALGVGCSDWTSNATIEYHPTGAPNAGGLGWSSAYSSSCDSPASLYCISTDYTATVSEPKASAGRKMFITDGAFSPGSNASLASADAVCQDEATHAGYSGVFKALLASSTPAVTAISRMNLNGTPWVRPDGIPLVAAAADLNSDSTLLLSAPQVSPTKQYFGTALVWTGSTSVTAMATAASSCTPSGGNSWTALTPGSFGNAGMAFSADSHSIYNFEQTPCSHPNKLYCFQQ